MTDMTVVEAFLNAHRYYHFIRLDSLYRSMPSHTSRLSSEVIPSPARSMGVGIPQPLHALSLKAADVPPST